MSRSLLRWPLFKSEHFFFFFWFGLFCFVFIFNKVLPEVNHNPNIQIFKKSQENHGPLEQLSSFHSASVPMLLAKLISSYRNIPHLDRSL